MYGESRRGGTGPPLVEKQLEKGCEKESMVMTAIRGNWEGYGVCILHTPGGATDSKPMSVVLLEVPSTLE